MTGLLARTGTVLTSPVRAVRDTWRRSLQVRVVLTTFVLCAVVIVAVGAVLLRQVSEGLVDNRRDVAISVAEDGFANAQQQLDAALVSDFASESRALEDLYAGLVGDSGAGDSFDVVLIGPLDQADVDMGQPGERSPAELSAGSIPVDLSSEVEASDGVFWTYTRIGFDDARPSVPGVAVGERIETPGEGNVYGLYYLFSMQEQATTVSQISTALIPAGVALALLVASVAWLVTRQVVTPVRLARRTAERLAAGRLEQRIHVTGEDDLARLATSFNQMAASLQTQIRRLEDLSRVQQRFVSDVSHELRTPLTTVRMAADVLHDARTGFDPVTARSAELLQNELERFESLLTDLLEISRFDAGAAVLETAEIDLRGVARGVVAAYEGLAERHDVELRLLEPPADADGEVPPVIVEADVRRIERVVRNLVANAIAYSRSATVEVRVLAGPDAVALTVRDHGIGLQPGESQMVFTRFWRADPSRQRASGGTGLGLAIAQEDAQLHGGWLQAWGEPGRGAQFRLTLPVRAGEEFTRSPLPLRPRDLVGAHGATPGAVGEVVGPGRTT